jgi:hypothetical protein
MQLTNRSFVFVSSAQVISFLFFAVLMVLDMGLFMLLAVFYKPLEQRKQLQDETSSAIRANHPQYTSEQTEQ